MYYTFNFNCDIPSEVNRRTCLPFHMNICSESIALLYRFRKHPVVRLAVGSFRAHTVPCFWILLFMVEINFLGIASVCRFQIHLNNHLIGMDTSEHRIMGQINGLCAEHFKFVVPCWHPIIPEARVMRDLGG